ncbi:amidohydrolase family protein [Leeia oryzae]|uniref:amidohydrolase family protein n=1 Tax=Leeia oryzae TaxID=356662 RepID=UPI000527ADCB|nr:amidohydrolase family protein [Leeia oryzae]
METTCWIRRVRPYGGDMQDIKVVDGRIAALTPASDTPASGADLDGQGQLLTLPLVESHIHLDKTLWGLPWRAHSAGPSLTELIGNERQVLRTLTSPIAERAGALLAHCIAKGTQLVRCHVDVDPELGLRHVEAMLALRTRFAPLVDMQLVAFPQTGLITNPGTAALMREAVAMGVDVLGGLDPCGIDKDPIAHLTSIFELARDMDCGVDIHLHDGGELGLWEIERIIDFTERYQRQGRVMISHAFCLGMKPWPVIAPLAARLAANGVSILSSAPADIEIPPFLPLQQAGVNVCLGSDGIRDAWTPMGNGDMLERAMLLAYRFDMRRDDELQLAFEAATRVGAKALGHEDYGMAVGKPAHFVLFPSETLAEAIVSRPLARTVIRHGRVIARDGQLLAEAG